MPNRGTMVQALAFHNPEWVIRSHVNGRIADVDGEHLALVTAIVAMDEFRQDPLPGREIEGVNLVAGIDFAQAARTGRRGDGGMGAEAEGARGSRPGTWPSAHKIQRRRQSAGQASALRAQAANQCLFDTSGEAERRVYRPFRSLHDGNRAIRGLAQGVA